MLQYSLHLYLNDPEQELTKMDIVKLVKHDLDVEENFDLQPDIYFSIEGSAGRVYFRTDSYDYRREDDTGQAFTVTNSKGESKTYYDYRLRKPERRFDGEIWWSDLILAIMRLFKNVNYNDPKTKYKHQIAVAQMFLIGRSNPLKAKKLPTSIKFIHERESNPRSRKHVSFNESFVGEVNDAVRNFKQGDHYDDDWSYDGSFESSKPYAMKIFCETLINPILFSSSRQLKNSIYVKKLAKLIIKRMDPDIYKKAEIKEKRVNGRDGDDYISESDDVYSG